MNAKKDILDNDSLREALRLMVEESAPAAGWEERVLAKAPKPRRRLRLIPGIGSAAAAAVIALMLTFSGADQVESEISGEWRVESSGPELLLARAPQTPRSQSSPRTQSAQSTPKTPSAPEPTVILPEPLPEPIIPVADYIDGLLAQQIELEQELLVSMIDPSFDNSYTPLN